jgi:hypothetical protein
MRIAVLRAETWTQQQECKPFNRDILLESDSSFSFPVVQV